MKYFRLSVTAVEALVTAILTFFLGAFLAMSSDRCCLSSPQRKTQTARYQEVVSGMLSRITTT